MKQALPRQTSLIDMALDYTDIRLSIMKILLKVIACIGFTLTLAVVSHAKDWRGLTPLHSTRADVERLLGEPPHPPKDGSRAYTLNKGRSIYFLDEGEIYIVFAEAGSPAAVDCSGKIPADTVMSIFVTLKNETRVSDLQIDEKKFRKFDPSQPPELGYEAYLNEQDGLLIKAFKGKVEEVIYIASAQDKHLCSSYYQNAESFVQVFVCGLNLTRKFDEYGNLSFSDEKARLDNFAIQLQNETEVLGYIITYAGRKSRAGEAQARADRAKRYLENARGMESSRIITVDGGYREESSVELYLDTIGTPPPTPSPTVDPSEVQIIYGDGKPRKNRAKP